MVRKKTILAIDDTTVNLMAIRDALDSLNDRIDLRLAKNSALALKTLKSVKVDLILLDIDMPDISGFELFSIFKDLEYAKNIPVIFVTSTGDSETVLKASSFGAVDYIIKPIKASIICSKVINALKNKSS